MPICAWLLITLALVAGIVLWWRYASGSFPQDLEEGAAMPKYMRGILVGYLGGVALVIFYVLISATALEFPETPVLPEPSAQGTAGYPAGGTTSAPVLLHVFPQSTLDKPPTVELALYGSNFTAGSSVRINMLKHDSPRIVSANLVMVTLRPSELKRFGVMSIDVMNTNREISNAISLPITSPRVPLNIFGCEFYITRETQLLLLALFSGALGSYIHALRSFIDFRGNSRLAASWFWWYISRPVLGMAMSLIFYAVLRGGFLAGTPSDARVVSPFGVITIGALVGMFADKAGLKLAEIFDTLFKARDERSDKLDAPVVTKLEPRSAAVGTPGPLELKITGKGLGKTRGVRLNMQERKPDSVSNTVVTLNLQTADLQNRSQLKVAVIDEQGSATGALTFHVTDLVITSTNLPNAAVGANYNATLAATGGRPAYKWELSSSPAWLKIDANSGQLGGKPKTPGVVSITVNVEDQDGAAVSKDFQLIVQ